MADFFHLVEGRCRVREGELLDGRWGGGETGWPRMCVCGIAGYANVGQICNAIPSDGAHNLANCCGGPPSVCILLLVCVCVWFVCPCVCGIAIMFV